MGDNARHHADLWGRYDHITTVVVSNLLSNTNAAIGSGTVDIIICRAHNAYGAQSAPQMHVATTGNL